MSDLPPNHHADYKQFTGLFGYVGALTMVVGRADDARLVIGLADIGPSDDVLDIGCGPGTAARLAARTGAKVTGLDPSGPMLRIARLTARSNNIIWVEAGAENLPLDDAAFDVCWSLASVHHWPDLEGGLDEVERVLQPRGTFIALEKRTEPGAEGNAGHGWTDQQADTFAELLTERGWADATVAYHQVGKRRTVTVTARRA